MAHGRRQMPGVVPKLHPKCDAERRRKRVESSRVESSLAVPGITLGTTSVEKAARVPTQTSTGRFVRGKRSRSPKKNKETKTKARVKAMGLEARHETTHEATFRLPRTEGTAPPGPSCPAAARLAARRFPPHKRPQLHSASRAALLAALGRCSVQATRRSARPCTQPSGGNPTK
ncbi:hypothetical protein L1887_55808 [Cichorium endivia]|nr:hypothetical protein L1887_55808 [Cichorium endivia]